MMKRHLGTLILGLSNVSMILAFVLILIHSNFATGSEILDDFPPYVKEMLEEEGISPEEMVRELEDLKNALESSEGMDGNFLGDLDIPEKSQETQENTQESEESPEEKPDNQQRELKNTKRGGQVGSGDEYYKSIVEKNLFRNLGWSGEGKSGPDFRIVGTVINQGKKPRALIFEFANNTTHYVAVGDIIGNATVESISEKSVTLKKNGEEGPLKLNVVKESPFLGGSGGDKGRKPQVDKSPSPPKNVKSSASRGGKSDRNLRERYQKMSRKEREEFTKQMKENQRRNRGGTSSRSSGSKEVLRSK